MAPNRHYYTIHLQPFVCCAKVNYSKLLDGMGKHDHATRSIKSNKKLTNNTSSPRDEKTQLV